MSYNIANAVAQFAIVAGSLGIVTGGGMIATDAVKRNTSYRKVGGLHFVRVWKLSVSFCVTNKR